MNRRRLILMRHAKSDWNNPGIPDHDRPLNQRGVRAAKLIGRFLEESSMAIELVLASTAVRVQQTLEIMQRDWKALQPKVINSRSLYLATSESILHQVSHVQPDTSNIMVIGHNPGLEELGRVLCGKGIRFPTACVAEFQTDASSWQEAVGHRPWELGQVILPRDLE